MDPHDEGGDRYVPTPAVLTEAAGPVAARDDDGSVPGPPPEYPNLWGVKGLRRVVPEALRIWRAALPAMLGIGFVYAIIAEIPRSFTALVVGGLSAGEGYYIARTEIAGAFGIVWEVAVRLPVCVWLIVLVVLLAAEVAAGRRRPPLHALFGRVWESYWRVFGAIAIAYVAVAMLKLAGSAAAFLVADDPTGARAAASSAERELVAALIADWLPLVPMAFLVVRWELSTSTALFERARPLRALRRSARLAGQCWLPAAALIGLAHAIRSLPPFLFGLAAPEPGGPLATSVGIAWTTATFGLAIAVCFALYAALRDRELAMQRPEDRAGSE